MNSGAETPEDRRLEDMADRANIMIVEPNPELQLLLDSLIMYGRLIPSHLICIPQEEMPSKMHFDGEEPLAKAAETIIDDLSSRMGKKRPSGYRGDHPYWEREAYFMLGRGIAIRLPRVHFYNWVADLKIATLEAFPGVQQPQSLDLVVFESPQMPGKFVYQIAELGTQLSQDAKSWGPYVRLFDAGVHLPDTGKTLSMLNSRLITPMSRILTAPTKR